MNKTLAELVERKTLDTNRVLDATTTADDKSHLSSLIVENTAHRIHRHPVTDGDMPAPSPISGDEWPSLHPVIMLEVDTGMESLRDPESRILSLYHAIT
jgi:hypothetical protein